MKKQLIGSIIAVCAMAVQAEEMREDSWTSGDKFAHMRGGLLIGGVTTYFTKSAGNGVVAGCATGIAGELIDASRYGWHSVHVSYKDATMECLGAVISSGGTRIIIGKDKITWKVTF